MQIIDPGGILMCSSLAEVYNLASAGNFEKIDLATEHEFESPKQKFRW